MKKISLNTPKGYAVEVTEFIADTKIKPCIIIASATGVKQTLYQKFSLYLQEHGYAVYTFDYGGIGDSKKTSLKQFQYLCQ